MCCCSCWGQFDDKEPACADPLYITDEDTPETSAPETDPLPEVDLGVHWEKYKQLKKRIRGERSRIGERADLTKTEKRELVESYVSQMLVDSVFTYWLGTKWDFNGHTERPRDGEVACGYFVSTTLRDVGLKLNRYKTAQKAAADIVKQLCRPQDIQDLHSMQELDAYLDTIEENEIIVVGMDYHVGFLYVRDDQKYFAHSSYVDRYGVEVQLIEESEALMMTKQWIVGKVIL